MSRSKVAVLRVQPDSVLDDLDKIFDLGEVSKALDPGAQTILKDIFSPLVQMSNLDYHLQGDRALSELAEGSDLSLSEQIEWLEKRMRVAAKALEFEEAAALRDKIRELRELQIYSG